MTGLKVIEDIGVFSRFGSELPLLRGLRCEIRPMGEDIGKFDRYFEALRKLYADHPSLEDYGHLFRDWGISHQIAGDILDAAVQIEANAEIKSQVLAIYGKVLRGL
jgi:hypothetical protein